MLPMDEAYNSYDTFVTFDTFLYMDNWIVASPSRAHSLSVSRPGRGRRSICSVSMCTLFTKLLQMR